MRDIKDIIKEIDIWRSAKKISYEILNGGCTNCTYKINVDEVFYVLRVNGDQNKFLGLKREDEVEVLLKASQIGIAPKIYTTKNKSEYLITEYINGRIISSEEIHNNDFIKKVAKVLHEVHNLEGVNRECSPFYLVNKYIEGAKLLNVELPEGLYEVLKNVDIIEKRCSINSKYNKKYCHNDFYTFNIINNGCDLYVIDWELSGIGDVFFDLATISFSNRFSKEEDELLLRSYFGNLEDEYKVLMYDMKYMNMIREISWALLHSGMQVKKVNHDINYYESALWFIKRLKEGIVTV